MKKIFAIVSAFAALVACTKVAPVVDDSLQEENQEIKVNFTISREDDNTGTKASVKTAFSENDVVFIFFNGLNAPKRLEMTYTSGSWTPTFYGEILASDLTDGGTLTAIYLPYGSGITVDGTGETFTFSEAYKGYYLIQQRTYEFKSNTITAAISLQVAPPTSGSDVIVHFDVSGLSSTHEYNMYQEYVKPLTLTAISKTGTVTQTVGTAGNAILGHQDAGFVSFSGVLDASAVGAGNAKTYQFFVRDETLGTLYYRTTASAKPISANSYIGLGSATASPSPWAVASPGAFSVSETERVTIARSNLSYLGATGGKKPWQLMKFPWSTIEETGASFYPASNKDFSLFGFATSGWDPSVLTEDPKVTSWINFNPWSYDCTDRSATATYANNKYGYGPEGNINTAYPNGDWGYYNTTGGRHIYQYGGNSALDGTWRTLNIKEWRHLLAIRPNATYTARTCDHIFAKAIVGGMAGLIIFPDVFSVPAGIVIKNENINFKEPSEDIPYSDNTYTPLQWNKIEAAGAVFLPCAGIRSQQTKVIATNVIFVGEQGQYWSSQKATNVAGVNITIQFVDWAGNSSSYVGKSVRLVQDIPAAE